MRFHANRKIQINDIISLLTGTVEIKYPRGGYVRLEMPSHGGSEKNRHLLTFWTKQHRGDGRTTLHAHKQLIEERTENQAAHLRRDSHRDSLCEIRPAVFETKRCFPAARSLAPRRRRRRPGCYVLPGIRNGTGVRFTALKIERLK